MEERTMPGFSTGHRRQWFGLVAVLMACVVGACSDEQANYPEAPDRIAPLTLRADGRQLQPPVLLEALNVRFQVPAGWAPLDSAAARRAQRSVLFFNNRRVHTTPLRTYGEQRTSSFLVVSRIRSVDMDSTVQAIVEQTLAAHEPDFQRVDTLRQADGPPIFDFVMASQNAVHHKVLVGSPGTQAVQFDYVAPRIHYRRTISVIERSLGSIRSR